MDNWYVYIIETEGSKLYTGITKDIENRFQKHLDGKGAKFFRTDKPKKIVYTEQLETHGEALKREYEIKQMTKKKKLELIS